ncbi:MAG: F-box protein: endocytic membrane traffic, recycling ReCYcling 1 [Peltula sp. TS41687]|nr:MAG: F-box protein: endocytic membrane traffic, recycling ReCYcling 1 [Peltula sp. TS41687]
MSTSKRDSVRSSVAGGAPKRDSRVLAPLKAAEIVAPKPALPAELLATILEYLSIPDLLRCACVSKRLKEMVYEDGRWIRRLKLMGCWDEALARRESEATSRRTLESGSTASRQGAVNHAGLNRHLNGIPGTPSSINSAGGSKEEQRQKANGASHMNSRETSSDGFMEQVLLPKGSVGDDVSPAERTRPRSLSVLQILSTSTAVTDPMVFRSYQTPEQQAKMLAQLSSFSKSDITPGGQTREEKVQSMIDIFEDAVVREFEQGLRSGDSQRMQKYAQVMVILNGGQKAVDLFITKHPLRKAKDNFGDPMECIHTTPSGSPSLEPSYFYFERISKAINEERKIIDHVFPASLEVFLPFFDQLGGGMIAEYVTTLLDEAHRRSVESYLKVVPGLYEQARAFLQSIRPSTNSTKNWPERSHSFIVRLFEPHLELYLQEELDFFTRKSNAEVDSWEKKLSEEDASTESFFMSNVNRQAVKKDFLSSFKKVVMMPVNVLPSFPLSSPFGSGKPSTGDSVDAASRPSSRLSARPLSASLPAGRTASPGLPSGLIAEAPTTELAAKTALMNSRLEGIRSLFSIEVALNLTHAAKASLDRAALFVALGGQLGQEAKEQCETIFILLLQILNSKHIKPGFDKAVDHLSKYNPREVSEHNQPGVAPLVTFLELVNVGDLILQMIDVFYEQELIATKLVDRTDFLASPVKEKKRFEQMLDERVAAGLNKGIDVLMEEVEFLLSTTQQPTDFNPPLPTATSNQQSSSSADIDIGPTATAKRVVEMVSSHTTMLQGSTDKNLLDVFNQEVGLRLFTALCKHIKRQRISIEGSIKLISDMTHYSAYISTLRNPDLLQFFKALRELSQIYLIDCSSSSSSSSSGTTTTTTTTGAKNNTTTTTNKAQTPSSSACKDLATVIADPERFHGVWRAEEVYEFVERRADWYLIKRQVERAMYGVGCGVM